MAKFTVALTIEINDEEWNAPYGNTLNDEGVKEYLENCIFIGSDHQPVTVHHIVEHP